MKFENLQKTFVSEIKMIQNEYSEIDRVFDAYSAYRVFSKGTNQYAK